MIAAIRLTLALAMCLPAAAAQAAASDWHAATGAEVRLVMLDSPEADGTWKGALEIALQPGWKTYWRDPGDAGIPPQIDVAPGLNLASAEILFPAPVRLGGADGGWAGYDRPVALPVVLRIADPARFAAVEADVLLGVCEDICVPVQARLSVPPAAGSDMEATRIVEQAFASLPGPASAAFGITGLAAEGETLFLAAAGTTADAHLYLVSPPGWVLGIPTPASRDGQTGFAIDVMERPRSETAPPPIDYTLVDGAQAASGTAAP